MSAPLQKPRFGARVVEAAPARRRIAVAAFVLMAAFAALASRATYLAFAEGDAQQVSAPVETKTRRDVVDRNGVLLAGSVRSWTLVAHPKEAWRPEESATALAKLFPDLDREVALRRLSDQGRDTVYLKPGLSERQKAEVLGLALPGVDFEPASRRVYPQGALAAHVLGGVNRAFEGVAGVERGLEAEIARAASSPVALSIDVRLQHALEAELGEAAAKHGAKGAAGVLLDAKTGEVLALASLPSFDPNAPPPGDAPERFSRAVSARMELGSVVKPLLFAAALDAGLASPTERFRANEPLVLPGLEVKDEHALEAPVTLAEGLARSSNVVAATIALRMGRARVVEAYRAFGLSAPLAIELPGASAAAPAPATGGEAVTATLGYGYGMQTSLLALAQAYGVFCNEGAYAKATLRRAARGDAPALARALSPGAAQSVLAMLGDVVRAGTAQRAGGVDVAGKTGTAQKAVPGGYDASRVLATFAGVFPAESPRWVIVVSVDEPANAATGGEIAAPVAAAVIARAAPLLGAPPARGRGEVR